jgi:hypothetical protein
VVVVNRRNPNEKVCVVLSWFVLTWDVVVVVVVVVVCCGCC